MSVLPRINNAYGFSQPQIQSFPPPIIANRNPGPADKGQLGQLWIVPTTNIIWMLASIINNISTWIDIGGGVAANTYVTNAGNAIPAAGILNILGDGVNINTTGGGNTVTVVLDNAIHLPATNAAGTSGVIYIGGDSFLQGLGTGNCFVGDAAGNFTLTVGSATLNTGVGSNALASLTTGANNAALGADALNLLTTGSNNVALGEGSLSAVLTGGHNIAVGTNAGSNYTAAESNNILVGNTGTASETNTIRIGVSGSGTAQQNKTFVAGISTVSSLTESTVVGIDTATDQLFTTTITAGAGITVTAGAGTITIASIDGGLPWTDVTAVGPTTMAVNHGYIANNASFTVLLLLPAAAAEGSIVRVSGKGAGGWQITQQAGQTIHFGAFNSTTGVTGSLASTLQYDTVELLCTTANTDFVVLSAIGNLAVT